MSAPGGSQAPAIELANVSKIYRRYGARHFATLKSALMQRSILQDLKPEETFQALTDVSMRVPAGCTMGLVGRNGSGKSTALKLVAGITKPTTGSVNVRGRISALIELGAGFHPEISGRENVFINGIMLGLTKREIERRFDEIVEFAELKDFIDEPVKSYSSGMYMRLGFAVATHVDPDVLLVDEVLAVGDEGFTHKCLDKFGDFKRRGKTILLVTHSLNLVERFCDEAVWLDAGRKRVEGDPKRVIDAYISDVERDEEKFLAASDEKAQHEVVQAPPAEAAPAPPVTVDDPTSDMMKASEGRWGSRQVEILDVALLDRAGQPAHIFQSGDPMIVRLAVRAEQPVDDCVFGVALFNAEGTCVY
ncbi:MAG TPA: ABC transporter ATP-binding protein, partial [Vicinamibacterales bacterium]|nr:ABC transporter ATP-binding protein [Vicinamibacterales bacterium]